MDKVDKVAPVDSVDKVDFLDLVDLVEHYRRTHDPSPRSGAAIRTRKCVNEQVI